MGQPFFFTEEGSRPRLNKSSRARELEWNERSGGAFCEAARGQCKEVSRLLLYCGRRRDVGSRLKRIHVLCEASLGGVVAVEGWGAGAGQKLFPRPGGPNACGGRNEVSYSECFRVRWPLSPKKKLGSF